MKHLLTNDGLTVVINGKPYSISSSTTGFDKIRDAVLAGADPQQVLFLIQEKAIKIQELVSVTLAKQNLTGRLTYEEGVILYEGKPIHNYAVEHLVKLLSLGHDVSALANFIDRQQQNPTKFVHDELYKFLEFGKIPLTPDGHFLTYKAVRKDYMDIHSGTLRNMVGDRPRMPGGRPAVDPNRNNVCSTGLHVCSYGYLPSFSHADGHVMMCKVDPFDVVAIPPDYNNTKMRVVTYEVVGEVTSYYGRGEDVLAAQRLQTERFAVQYEWNGGLREVYDNFFTREDAQAAASALICDEVRHAWVVDTKTGETVYET